jgi:hypothetical protein
MAGTWTKAPAKAEADGEWCASQDCYGDPDWYFEAGGVGSYYCSECKAKIQTLAADLKQHATN